MNETETPNWSLLFNTKDGMCHPLRISYREPQPESAARRYAENYVREHSDWLESVDAVYPTDAAYAALRKEER